ncbi:hypothetical protein [Alteraurantiacibacter aquimixticola]|uniref:Uncharacterized protein n=1 Tax=Alteraurantiacibacter aquimixticola TaxID=2489173 RepID=A0A4T3EYS3_9SPHN|nr:hypothetical protein [Alteraurantiacibacter aquimixticola]TIX49671.1 hypothetical protein E5222_12665 [Alteraurantiacibacter aquimixticola]
MTITLSSVTLDPATGLKRDAARPAHLRNESYAERYDWDTLFYDVYRAGKHVVFQGPPFLNLLEPLRQSAPFKGAFGLPFFRARHFGEKKRGEIWLRSDASEIAINGPIGRYNIDVQPDMAESFAGRRVITTLSKDNDLRWIADWVRFHVRIHGADGVLFYDNRSTAYALEELQATLDEAAGPDVRAVAVSWPFAYGPQGGLAGAVNGVEADWDSDFCQTGSLQHARHRFLRHARSVLNVDVDELVLGTNGESIFAATEASRAGFTKFPGRWISGHTDHPVTRETCRHADFIYRDAVGDGGEDLTCPPKWCVVPGRGDRLRDSWSVHNLFGAKANLRLSDQFVYRHMRAISTSWKEQRWEGDAATDHGPRDEELGAAFAAAGLTTCEGPVLAEGARVLL